MLRRKLSADSPDQPLNWLPAASATSTASAASAASAASTASTASTRWPCIGLIHPECPSAYVLAVQFCNCFLSIAIAHLDETEAS